MLLAFCSACDQQQNTSTKQKTDKSTGKEMTAKDILGNPDYLAISYGGYRKNSREIQPGVAQLKEDMKVLAAMGIKVLRTYNVKLKHASNVLAAIRELKEEDSSFEMYVMLGAWIDCKDAWTSNPDHSGENETENTAEIQRAVDLANQYPDIVKIIAVGNEAMVKWASSYYVEAEVILRWVNHLQKLKQAQELPKDLWITSSDNFASWGGGGEEYHTEDLNKLIQAVDYISLHTYPMHDTHYNPDFWGISKEEEHLSKEEQIAAAMDRARDYAIQQYQNTADYIKNLEVDKSIHIGETGWATTSKEFYGPTGSRATDEYKQALYYQRIREWSNKASVSCFYFEAFDENWKDAQNPDGSENHFGLFTIDGQAKYVLWDLVDRGTFKDLGRNGQLITKTYNGNKAALLEEVAVPAIREF